MKNLLIEKDISYYIYNPLSKYRQRLDRYCSYHVYSNDRGDFGGHQCSRKPKIKINGFGFCKFHAKRTLKRFEKLDLINDLG